MNKQPGWGVLISRSGSLITYPLLPALNGRVTLWRHGGNQVWTAEYKCRKRRLLLRALVGASTNTVHTYFCRLWLLNIQKLQNLRKLRSAHRYKLSHIHFCWNENIPFCLCSWEVPSDLCQLLPFDDQMELQLCIKSQKQSQLCPSMLREDILFFLHDTYQQSFLEKYVDPTSLTFSWGGPSDQGVSEAASLYVYFCY